jgi:hypothetical protein
MSTTPVSCPSCSARMNCPQELLGNIIVCPTCRTSFAAPPPPSVPLVASLPEPTPHHSSGNAGRWADVAVVGPLPEPTPATFRTWVLPAVAVPALLLGVLIGYFLPHPSDTSAPQRERGDQWKEEGIVGPFGRSREKLARAGAVNVGKALTAYHADHDQYPNNLAVLTQKDDLGGPYIDAEGLLDPWGQEYQVDVAGPHHNGAKPDVFTTSPEGKIIGNWDR